MEYQGHRSKAAWNVALWISNDEPLYRFAIDTKRRYRVQIRRLSKGVDVSEYFNTKREADAFRDLPGLATEPLPLPVGLFSIALILRGRSPSSTSASGPPM